MGNKLRRRHKTWHSIRVGKKVRTCLMCGRRFKSNGPHNRRCCHCNNLLEHSREGSYYQPPIYSVERGKTVDSLDTG